MSILQDLAPHQPETPRRAADAGEKRTVWMLSATMIAMGIAWLVSTVTPSSRERPAPEADQIAASRNSTDTTHASSPPVVGTIDNGARVRDVRPLVREPLVDGQDRPTNLVAAHNPDHPQAPVEAASLGKSADKRPRKNARETVEPKAANLPAASVKKASERDVDIITAIVR